MLATLGVDPSTAWASLILQGGAFGLLTYIVTHLAPRLLREARLEREQRDRIYALAQRRQTRELRRQTDCLIRVEESLRDVCKASCSNYIHSAVADPAKTPRT